MDKFMNLQQDIEKLREEMENELPDDIDSKLNDKKLIKLSKRLDEIIVNYMKS